jgi:hypothetical protein
VIDLQKLAGRWENDGIRIPCQRGEDTRVVPWGSNGRLAITSNGITRELLKALLSMHGARLEFDSYTRVTISFEAKQLDAVCHLCSAQPRRAAG